MKETKNLHFAPAWSDQLYVNKEYFVSQTKERLQENTMKALEKRNNYTQRKLRILNYLPIINLPLCVYKTKILDLSFPSGSSYHHPKNTHKETKAKMDAKLKPVNRVYEDIDPQIEWAYEEGLDTVIVHLPG